MEEKELTLSDLVSNILEGTCLSGEKSWEAANGVSGGEEQSLWRMLSPWQQQDQGSSLVLHHLALGSPGLTDLLWFYTPFFICFPSLLIGPSSFLPPALSLPLLFCFPIASNGQYPGEKKKEEKDSQMV